MNFSEEYDCPNANNGGCQSIFFATSKDLKNWTRVLFAAPPANDSNVFKYWDGGLGGTTPGYKIGGRWDTIATVPKPGFPGIYYGFWTASPACGHGAGVGETTDQTGHHWKALPPITDGIPSAELGSTVVLNGKYYMLFGGGHIYSSDNPIQGYKPDAKNPAFHTDGDGVAFSRLWNVQGKGANASTVLISHQWMTDGMTGSGVPGAMGSKGIYLGPLKEMKVGADGTPRAMYWSGNEKLKGAPIALPPLPPPAPPAPPPPPEQRVDVASCAGGTTTWKVPAVGAAAGPISLKSTSSTTHPAHRQNVQLSPSSAPPPPVGTISNGTCGATSVGPDCNTAAKGSFPGMATMAACVAKLKGCKMANYASFSPPAPLGWNDCSWYSTCDFQHLCTGGCPTLPGPSPAGCPMLPKLKCSFTSEIIKLPGPAPAPGIDLRIPVVNSLHDLCY